MKRFLAMVVAVALIASWGYAQTSEVSSVNAVGYMTVVVPSNGYALASLQFNGMNGSTITMNSLVGTQLPVGSKAHIWKIAQKQYVVESRSLRSGWGTNTLDLGTGFWLEVPAGSATGPTHKVVFQGEVPLTASDPSVTVSGITGIDAMGYTYPVAVVWTNTKLAKDALVGDKLHVWNPSITNYDVYSKSLRSGWSSPVGFTLSPAQGFWYETTGSTNWTENIPYSL